MTLWRFTNMHIIIIIINIIIISTTSSIQIGRHAQVRVRYNIVSNIIIMLKKLYKVP